MVDERTRWLACLRLTSPSGAPRVAGRVSAAVPATTNARRCGTRRRDPCCRGSPRLPRGGLLLAELHERVVDSPQHVPAPFELLPVCPGIGVPDFDGQLGELGLHDL